jgi:hypothetical protein
MRSTHGPLAAPQRLCLQRRQALQHALRRLEAEGRRHGLNVACAMYDPLWEYEIRKGEEAMKATFMYQRIEAVAALWSFLYQVSIGIHRALSRAAHLVGIGGVS